MTFYNIIFGILFLGGVREIFVALTSEHGGGLLAFWEASILTLLIFSDVVYTSHVLEELKYPYTVWMKLIDLTSFILLTAALLLLNPTASNLLQVPLDRTLAAALGTPLSTWLFWTLLVCYWALLTLWVRIGDIHPNRTEFDALISGSGTPALLRRPWAKRSLWFLIRWGRLVGLLILAFVTIIAWWHASWLSWLAPLIFSLTVLYLLINGVILSLYPQRH